MNVMLPSLLLQTLRLSISVSDYWEETVQNEHINVQEMWAVLKELQSLPESISDCRIDSQVDRMVVFHTWSGLGFFKGLFYTWLLSV